MRRFARTDQNQAKIIAVLRAVGCRVQDLSAIGDGCADLMLLTPRRELMLIEVKNLSGRGNILTPGQVKFHAEWPVTVVTTPEEALAAVGIHNRGME